MSFPLYASISKISSSHVIKLTGYCKEIFFDTSGSNFPLHSAKSQILEQHGDTFRVKFPTPLAQAMVKCQGTPWEILKFRIDWCLTSIDLQIPSSKYLPVPRKNGI